MDYLLALHQAGIELDIRLSADADLSLVPERFRVLTQFCNSQNDGWPSHVIVHSVPSQATEILHRFPTGNAKKIVVTTWETSALPPIVSGRLVQEVFAQFDLVLVPSTWNWAAFAIAGIEHVRVVPHCFDPTWWFTDRPVRHANFHISMQDVLAMDDANDAYDKAVRAQYPTQPYVFYNIGTWAERKNPTGLLKAYLTAFTSQDRVLLRMVCPAVPRAEVEALVRSLGLHDLPAVEFVGKLTDEELRNIHVNSDCYVTLSRGEGWGLGAFEAALVGNPVIAPTYGAFPDFLLHHADSYFVPVTETPAITPPTVSETVIHAGPLSFRPVLLNSPTGIRGDQLWAEPDISAAREYLRVMMEGCFPYETTTSRESLTRLFSYEAVSKRFLGLLARL